MSKYRHTLEANKLQNKLEKLGFKFVERDAWNHDGTVREYDKDGNRTTW